MTVLAPERLTEEPTQGHFGLVLAALSGATGLVHFAAAPDHFEAWWGYGVFFLVVACAQVAWSVAVMLRPQGRALLLAGALGNLAVVTVWALSRTAGVPLGPHAGVVEPIGLVDTLATVWELAVVTVAGVIVLRPALATRTVGRGVTGTLAVASLVLGGLAFTPLLARPHTEGDGHAHGSTDAAAASETDIDAGGHGHGAGLDDPPPTSAQRAAADRLVEQTRVAVAPFADLDQAVAAGYRPITPPEERIVHYGHPSYMLDADVLDPQKVESLVYARTRNGPVFLGAMYMMPLGARGPEIGGSLTRWHAHDDLCIDVSQLAQVARRADGSCPPGSAVQRTPEMLHVWSIEYPGGPFAELTPVAALQVLLSLD